MKVVVDQSICNLHGLCVETAPEVFDPLYERFRFTIDVAASKQNAKLPCYYTVEDENLELTQGQRPDVAHLEREAGAEPLRPPRRHPKREQRRRRDQDRVRPREPVHRQPREAQRERGPERVDRIGMGDAVDPHIVFLPGLFHDVGRIAFLLADDAAFGVVDAHVESDAKKRPDAERAWYGFDHAEAGAILAEDWGLVHEQVDAIRWHHQPGQADQGRLLAAVLNVGDAGAYVLGFGGGAVAPVDGTGREMLLLSADAVAEALAAARGVFAIHHDLFG